MAGFCRGIAPVVREAIGVFDRRIQRFVQVEPVDAHDVHVDVRVTCSVWHIHAVKYMDAAALAKRMVGYRVFAVVLRQSAVVGMKTEVVQPNLDEPQAKLAAEAAIAFRSALAEVDPGFELHRLAMTASAIGLEHETLSLRVLNARGVTSSLSFA